MRPSAKPAMPRPIKTTPAIAKGFIEIAPVLSVGTVHRGAPLSARPQGNVVRAAGGAQPYPSRTTIVSRGRNCRSAGPQAIGRNAGAVDEDAELRPHDRGMDAADERPLGEAAVGAGDDTL